MGVKLGFLRFYLVSVLIIALLGLTDAALTYFRISSLLYTRLVPLVLFIFFFFNIFCITLFRHQRLEKIVYVLPFYHLASYIIFLSIGLYFTITQIVPPWLSLVLISIQFFSSLFELVFSLYLLMRFGSSPTP